MARVFKKREEWWIDYRANGQRHREPVGASYSLAKEVLAKRLAEVAEQRHFPGRVANARTFNEVAADFPDISTSYQHADAACIYLVEDAKRYDVLVTDNLFGDLLTDLAGAVTGGIGFAASGNLNPARTGPSLFEPAHGAAHEIAGTGKANPLAAIRSGAMMLDFLGAHEAGARIEKAVLSLQAEQAVEGESLSTAALGDAVAERL